MATPEQKYGRVTPPRSNICCRPQAFFSNPEVAMAREPVDENLAHDDEAWLSFPFG
jgi:hypothetical protein